MARQRNPRRVALEKLRVMNGNVRTMVAMWSWTPRPYTRVDGRTIHRDRSDIPAEEYTENQQAEWDRLAKYMDVVAEQAADVARFARRQAVNLGNADSACR